MMRIRRCSGRPRCGRPAPRTDYARTDYARTDGTELTRELDVELITDGAIRQLVLFSRFTGIGTATGRMLSEDGLHPNAAGNEFLAGRVLAAMRRVFGASVNR